MLKEGDPAPEFQLPADDGQNISAKDLRGKHFALYFYPKASTPGCTTESNSRFRDLKSEFDKLNTIILGCSADSVTSQANFKSKQKLNFPLLGGLSSVIEAYGFDFVEGFSQGKSYLGIVRSTVLVGRRQSRKKSGPRQIKGHAAGKLWKRLKTLQ